MFSQHMFELGLTNFPPFFWVTLSSFLHALSLRNIALKTFK